MEGDTTEGDRHPTLPPGADALPPGADALPPGADAPSPVRAADVPAPADRMLSEAQRAAAFSSGNVSVDRAAALRAGSDPVPRRIIRLIILGFVVLGIGGIIGEKLIGNAGVGALTSTPVTTLAGTGVPATGPGSPSDTGTANATTPVTGGVPSPSPTPPGVPAVGASPNAVIGLTRLAGKPAPGLSLESQSGAPWSLADARGKVVVVAFANAECNDICPVLAQEITEADQMLASHRADVDFVVVNSDPLETSLSPVPPVLSRTGLGRLTNLTFLNGSLSALSAVWKSYGVTVAVDNADRVVTHNDVMDFIAPSGTLRLSASPFADENTLGIYSLQPGVIHTFARGMADSASGLLKGAS